MLKAADLQELEPYIKIVRLAEESGLNISTLRAGLHRGRELTEAERVALEPVLRELIARIRTALR